MVILSTRIVDDVSDLCSRMAIISVRLYEGNRVIYILSPEPPGDDFTPVDPELKVVYFATLESRPAVAPSR